MLVARAINDDAFVKWCALELGGYDSVEDVPGYRDAAATLRAIDAFDRNLPVYFKSGQNRMFSSCPIMQGIAAVAEFAHASEDAEFQVLFTPEVERKLIESMTRGTRSVFRVVQRSAFANVIPVVRQRVFDWAMERLHEDAQLPGGVDIGAMLGLRPEARAMDPATVEPRGSIDLSNAQLSGPVQIVMNSSGSSASLVQTEGIDANALMQLVQVLDEAIDAAKGTDDSADALVVPLQQLREVLQMQQPRPSWIKEAFKSVKTIAEGATGALLAELSKPHVQALLAQLAHGLS